MPNLFDLENIPPHTTPRLVPADISWAEITMAIIRHHSRLVCIVSRETDPEPKVVLINSSWYVLTGDVLDGWYLAETTPRGGELQNTKFYLLPLSGDDYYENNGRLPFVELPERLDPNMSLRERRQLRLYILRALMVVVRHPAA